MPIHNLPGPTASTGPIAAGMLDRLRQKNEAHRRRRDNSELAARIAAYELAYKMQNQRLKP